jgi:hypothetical protein
MNLMRSLPIHAFSARSIEYTVTSRVSLVTSKRLDRISVHVVAHHVCQHMSICRKQNVQVTVTESEYFIKKKSFICYIHQTVHL